MGEVAERQMTSSTTPDSDCESWWARPEDGTAPPLKEALLGDVDVDAASLLEAHQSVLEGVDRVVLAESNVVAGLEARAALANDDRPRGHCLSTVALDSSELGVGVATVAARALSFLMCH